MSAPGGSSPRWDLRHCARHGHVLYAPTESAARALLEARTATGQAWRCLRCATFVLPAAGVPVPGGPAAELPVVPRGPELRDRFVLKLLGLERALRGLIVLVLGYGAWRFRNAEAALRDGLRDLLPYAKPLATRLGVDLEHTSVVAAAQRLLEVRSSTLTLVAAGLVGYGLLQLVEGYGLWRARRWGEYVAVVATSGFLPIEAYEVLHGGSVLKWGTLAFNLAIVVWLVLSKRLFGVRGGHHAYLAARRGESVLDPDDLDLAPAVPATSAAPGAG
jgi:uncharacterized membrane protein (DUF2068 family)